MALLPLSIIYTTAPADQGNGTCTLHVELRDGNGVLRRQKDYCVTNDVGMLEMDRLVLLDVREALDELRKVTDIQAGRSFTVMPENLALL